MKSHLKHVKMPKKCSHHMETSQLTVMQYQNYWFLYDGNNGLKKANSRFFLALSSQHSQKEFLAKEQVSIFMLYYFTMPQNVL